MVRSLVILLMLAATCHAEWFTGTNADGRVVSVPVRTDPSLAYVVGGITTSTVPPVASRVARDPVLVSLERQYIAALGPYGVTPATANVDVMANNLFAMAMAYSNNATAANTVQTLAIQLLFLRTRINELGGPGASQRATGKEFEESP